MPKNALSENILQIKIQIPIFDLIHISRLGLLAFFFGGVGRLFEMLLRVLAVYLGRFEFLLGFLKWLFALSLEFLLPVDPDLKGNIGDLKVFSDNPASDASVTDVKAKL